MFNIIILKLLIFFIIVVIFLHNQVKVLKKWQFYANTLMDSEFNIKVLNSENTYVISNGDVNKEITIYLCIEFNNVIFDKNTIMSALLHELAHIKSPNDNYHGIDFNKSLSYLTEKCKTTYSWFDETKQMNSSYPCFVY